MAAAVVFGRRQRWRWLVVSVDVLVIAVVVLIMLDIDIDASLPAAVALSSGGLVGRQASMERRRQAAQRRRAAYIRYGRARASAGARQRPSLE